MNQILKILSLCIGLCLCQLTFGQDEHDYLDKKIEPKKYEHSWNKIVKNRKYPNPKVKPKEQEEKKEQKEQKSYSGPSFDFGPARIIIAIIGIALLVGIIIMVFGKQSFTKNKPLNKVLSKDLDEVAEAIHEYDLNALLHEAIQHKDFKSALRIYFLIAVKALSEDEHIAWKKDKTNYDYLSEIKEDQLKLPFQHLILTYEKVWFGDIHFDEAIYYKVEGSFSQFISSVEALRPKTEGDERGE